LLIYFLVWERYKSGPISVSVVDITGCRINKHLANSKQSRVCVHNARVRIGTRRERNSGYQHIVRGKRLQYRKPILKIDSKC
jgi:hypothetical protein